MRDAFGGVLSLVLVTIFLVIVSGILALIVNYTKAFRMKNIVISAIEQYNGSPGCFGTGTSNANNSCRDKIEKGAAQIGYRPTELSCPTGYEMAYSDAGLFCYKGSDTGTGKTKNYVYSIVTQVDINIPIINKIMGLSIFQVHGDTRPVELIWSKIDKIKKN